MKHSKPGSVCLADPLGHKHTFDRVLLYRPAGETIRLHRFRGRWLTLRVAEGPDEAMLPSHRQDVDGIALNVIVDSSKTIGHLNGFKDTIAFDRTGSLGQCFPGLQWPAIFIIDPAGELVAILSDDNYETFMHSLVQDGRTSPTYGGVDAIDRADLKL